MPLVTSGVEHGNLRELVLKRMEDLGTKCRDVRTREVGIVNIHQNVCIVAEFSDGTRYCQIKSSLFAVIMLQMVAGKHF